jgi:hypothetical protein
MKQDIQNCDTNKLEYFENTTNTFLFLKYANYQLFPTFLVKLVSSKWIKRNQSK